MTNTKLSIFIPTYKRHEYLRRAITSVINQAIEFDIEIYISSNGIDEENRKIAKNFGYNHLHYYENNENLGIDLNMLKVLEYSKTEYCLMLGDDDLLIEDTLKKILDELNGEFCGVLLNGWNVDQNTEKISKIGNSHTNIELPLEPGFVLENFWNKMHFGTLIINVPFSKKVMTDKFIGTKHAYSALPFLVNQKFKLPLKISSFDSVLIRDGEKSYSPELAKVLLVDCTKWLTLIEETHGNVATQVKLKYLNHEFSFLKLLKLLAQSNIVMNDFLGFPTFLKFKIKFISIVPISLRMIVVNVLIKIKKMLIRMRGESDVKSYL